MKGGRDVEVGAMAVVNTAVSRKPMPSLGDKMFAKRGSDTEKNIPAHRHDNKVIFILPFTFRVMRIRAE